MPANQQELEEECLRIRYEIIRQKEIAAFAVEGMLEGAARIKTARNIAWLKNRAATIKCPGAFPGEKE